MLMTLPDAYPELIQAQKTQARRESELREARRFARRARIAVLFGRGYARAKEIR